MKKYSIPTLCVIQIQGNDMIATSVVTVNGNGGVNLVGPGHGTVRAPGNRIWE